MVKKGQVYEGVVTDIAFPNKGRVQAEGETVIVKNALPGQKIRFSVSKARRDRAEGRLLEVLEPGANEKTPACGCFGACGGCLYLPLPYEQQLAIKEKQVRMLLEQAVRGGLTDTVFEGILPSPAPYGYRNKMEFSFGDTCKDGPLALGMHKRGSFYDIVTTDRCQLVDADFRLILCTVLDYFAGQNVTHYHRMRHEGFLRHLLVRKGQKSGEILVDLVTTSQGELDEKAFIEILLALQNDGEQAGQPDGEQCGQAGQPGGHPDEKQHGQNKKLSGRIVGILHTINDSLADTVQNDRTDILYGQAYFYEELLGLKFRVTPFSFFQTNSLGAEVLYETARRLIGATKDQTVFDLYSGTGTIAQLLAPVAKKVVGVEIVEEAVEAARENAALNGLANCEFLAGDVLKVIDEITDKPDFIVLDPPRDGVNPKALQKIIAFGVERMIYISCKPTSLARDLKPLQDAGYRVERAVAVDMFPWTGNVEVIALLSKLHIKQNIEVELKNERDGFDGCGE